MQITYKDKVTLQSNPNIPDENKVTAKDMNEIKSVVNSNEEEQQALNMSVQEIAQNVVNNSQEISNIKEEQTTQNDNIQTNSNNISDLQSNKADKNEIPTDLSQLSNDNTKFVNETGLENAIFQEKTQRQNADNNLQNQVDTNKTNIQTNATNIATNTQEINTIKAEQTTQNNRLNNLETDNTTNKDNISANTQEINNIKQEQTEQNTNISTNATNIESLQEENDNLKKIVSQLPQVTGQGTSITLENTIEAQFTKFDVEGNSTQETTTGKNLLPNNATTQTYFGITITKKDDGTLILNGTATDIIQLNLLNNKRNNSMLPEADTKYSLESGIYKLSGCNNGSSSTYKLDVWVDGAEGPKTTCFNQEVQFTLDEEKIVSYLRLVVYSGVTLNNVVIKPMVRLASVTDDTYEPYTGGIASPNPNYEQPILSSGDNGSINEKIQTRNLFKNLPNTLDIYSIVMNNDGKKITFKGTNSSSTFYPSFIFYADGSVATSQWHPTKQQIDKSKGYFTKTGIAYILSLLKSGTFSGSNPSFFIGKETTFTSSGIFANVDTYTTQIANNSEKVNFIAIGFTPSQQVDLTFKIQLEPGSTATPYVEHKEQDYSIEVQQPFRSIGDVRDCFVNVNGNWYERHYIGEVVLDGSRVWNKSSYSDEKYFCGFLATGISDLIDGSLNLNNFFRIGIYTTILDEECMSNSFQLNVRILASRLTENSANGFKQWLSTHNVKAYGRYVTPLDLPCTEEQIEALENLPSTYKDFTIIQSEDETEAYLEVSGIYDMNKLITRVETLETEV